MKFRLLKSYRYWWPVTVRIPDPETAGKMLEQSFRVEFEPKSREEMLASAEAAAKLQSLREIADHEAGEARAVVRNWDGVVDADGNPVPFSPDLLDQALQQTWFRKAVSEALTKSLAGEEARLGN